jgi:beta-fructofuranosidase
MASNGAQLNGTSGTLSGENAYVLFNRLGTCNHISFTVTTAGNTDRFGISMVRGTDSEKYYTMVVNPEGDANRKVNFEEEGEKGKGFIEGIDGYVFKRPENNVYKIDIFTDNSVMVMYINDVCSYTNRIYGIQKNCWSINNYGGKITISDVKVFGQK